MSEDWKQQFANESEKAVLHPMVQGVIEEQLLNLNVTKDSLVYYGLLKIAMYTATVARAQALNIDPDSLRLSRQEAGEALLDRAARLSRAGAAVTVVVVPEAQS